MWHMNFKMPLLMGMGLVQTDVFLETVGFITTIGKMIGDKRHLINKAMISVMQPLVDIHKEKKRQSETYGVQYGEPIELISFKLTEGGCDLRCNERFLEEMMDPDRRYKWHPQPTLSFMAGCYLLNQIDPRKIQDRILDTIGNDPTFKNITSKSCLG